MAIWQDLVSDHGFPHGYQTVKRFVHKLRGSTQPQAVRIIHTAAGEEAQADYGSGPMVRDPQTVSRYVCWCGVRVPVCGPSCMRKLFVAWVGVRGSWFSIICARESSLLIFTIPLSIHCFGMCLRTTVLWPCPAGLRIPIAKEKWKQVSDTRRKLHSKDCASRA